MSMRELDAFPLRAVYLPTPYEPAKVRSFIELMSRAVASNASLTTALYSDCRIIAMVISSGG